MMDIHFLIAGTDRTEDVSIDWSVEQVLTNEEDACSFLVIAGDKPATGEELIVMKGADKLFAGIIDTVKEESKTGKVTFYSCSARDYSYLIDKRLVVETYQNRSADMIFKDLAAKYAGGFSVNHVAPGAPHVETMVFNYKRPSDCFKELCDYVGWDWYVDYDKDLHFFNPAELAEQAPIVIDSTSRIRKIKHNIDMATLRNRVYVLGGTMLSDLQTVQWKADGVARIWTLPWSPQEVSLTVGEVPKAVGIEHVHEEADYDYLINSKEKYLRCSSQTTTPVGGTTISLVAKQEIDVITMAEDLESQAAIAVIQGGDGAYEHSIVEDSLITIEAAEAAGMADLREHANPRVKGSFETEIEGWQPGQLVDIHLPDRGLQGTYLVQKVTFAPVAPDKLGYKVEYGGRLLSIADFLKALVSAQQNKKLNDTAILHKFVYGQERLQIVDELITTPRSLPYVCGDSDAICALTVVADMPPTAMPPVTEGLIGWWKFNEGSGQVVADHSGQNNHGQVGSTTGADTNDPVWVTGGLQFIGDDYVRCPHLPIDDAVTYFFVARMDAIPAQGADAVYMGQVSNDWWGPAVGTNHESAADWWGNGVYVTYGEWEVGSIVCCAVTDDGVYSSGVVNGYINGALKRTRASGGLPNEEDTGDFGFGRLFFPDGDTAGSHQFTMYYAMAYGFVLTEEEVASVTEFIISELAVKGVSLT